MVKPMIDDIDAMRRWLQVPEEFRSKILDNVFCSNCFNTTIVNYSLSARKDGVLISGKCKLCGKNVARFVEDI